MPVRAVTFDAGDTLLHWGALRPQRFGYLCRLVGVDLSEPAALAAARAGERFTRQCAAAGEPVTADWYLRHNRLCLEAAAVPGDRDALSRRISEVAAAHPRDPGLWRVDPDVPSVLEHLRSAGLRLGIISNWDGTLEDVLRALHLHDRFDFVADSSVVGSSKPDQEIFRVTCAALGVAPGDCLHVGDRPEADAAGAQRAGLRWVVYDPLDCMADLVNGPRVRRLMEVSALIRGA